LRLKKSGESPGESEVKTGRTEEGQQLEVFTAWKDVWGMSDEVIHIRALSKP
jgi:hypothetical protein